jgi:hypothetical protein
MKGTFMFCVKMTFSKRLAIAVIGTMTEKVFVLVVLIQWLD